MTTASENADLLSPVLADLAVVVEGIGDAQHSDPTPCTEYDVGALRAHVLQWVATFAGGFANPDGRTPEPPDLAGLDAAAAGDRVRAEAETIDRAVRDGGALERPLRIGESAMPGELAFGMVLWEYQVHGWDLAVATGQDWSPPAAATEASLAFAPGMLTDEYQGEGKMFGPRVPVPDDAAPLERLLGLSGRDPAWGTAS